MKNPSNMLQKLHKGSYVFTCVILVMFKVIDMMVI